MKRIWLSPLLWMGTYCFSAYSMVWGLSWSWMYFMAECLCMAECIIHGYGWSECLSYGQMPMVELRWN